MVSDKNRKIPKSAIDKADIANLFIKSLGCSLVRHKKISKMVDVYWIKCEDV